MRSNSVKSPTPIGGGFPLGELYLTP